MTSYKSRSFQFICVSLIVILINFQDFITSNIVNIGLLDEILLLFSTFIYFFSFLIKGKFPKRDLYLIALILFSIFTSIVAYYLNTNTAPVTKVLTQTFISFKFFFVYMFYIVVFKYLKEVDFNKVIWGLFLISLIGFILNLFFPSVFDSKDASFLAERGSRIVGFQNKPNDLGILIGLFSIYLIVYHRCLQKFSSFTFLYGLCFIIIIATTSRSAFLIYFVGFFYGVFTARNLFIKSSLFYISVVSVIFFVIAVDSFYVNETIRNFSELSNIDNSRYIRFIMLVKSIELAIEFFPFGTGAGTFGTVLSQGSWVYSYLGLQNLEFFVDFWGIYDSNISGFIGEYGFLVTIFCFTLVYGYLKSVSISKVLLVLMFLIFFTINFFQPFISYHVNSFNFLLLIFSLHYARIRNDFY